MITFWNQKEIFMGNSLKKFSEVRAVLSANKIKYKYKVVSQNQGMNRGRTGIFGENMKYSNTYYIFIHNRDYDIACAKLHDNQL
jgi:hypothetical protein